MTKLEKLYSIIENSREVGVKLSKDVLQQRNNGDWYLFPSIKGWGSSSRP